MWSIVEAKSQLSEILRRAREGEPQVIGSQKPCVVISAAEFDAKFGDHDGEWLLKHTNHLGGAIKLPSRGDDRSGPIF